MKPHTIIQSLLISSVFISGLIVSHSFTDPLTASKQFYFYFSALAALGWMSLNYIRQKQTIKLSFSLGDTFVMAWLLYSILRVIFTPHVFITDNDFITIALLCALYFIAKHLVQPDKAVFSNTPSFTIISTFILGVALIQIIIGILQLSDTITVFNNNFKITGRYNNPGPYAIFLVIVLPYALGIVLYKTRQKYLKWLAIVVLIGTVIILPLTQSRTSWIAALTGVLFIVSQRYHLLEKLINTRIKKIIAITCTLSVLLIAGYTLFHYKKDSAMGRVLIWKVTLDMIKDKPLTGHGFSKYENAHNDYQAAYFKNNPDNSEEGMLAGDDPYAYNDYLQIAAELGIIGLLLFIGIFISPFLRRFQKTGSGAEEAFFKSITQGVIIAFLAGSFFTYVIPIIPLVSVGFIMAGLAASYQKPVFSIQVKQNTSRLLAALILITALLLARYEYNQMNAHKQWKDAYVALRSKNTEEALKLYETAYEHLQYDQLFMYNYGAELSVLQHYEKSVNILEKTLPLLNDADVYTYLGIGYYWTKEYTKSISAFKQASHMIPHLFYPKYCLVLTYLDLGKEQEAIKLAKEILAMPVKVRSEMVKQIKKEMQEFVTNYYNQNASIMGK